MDDEETDEEKTSFDDFVDAISKDDEYSNVERVNVKGCKDSISYEKLVTDEFTAKHRGFLLECGDTIFSLQMICFSPEYYDINEFDKIIESAEYEEFAKKHPKATTASTKATTKATTEETITHTTIPKATTKATTSSESGGNGFGTKLSDDDRMKTKVWICAQDVVEQDLKSPSSAKFCKGYETTVYHQNGNQYIAMGYVDADNSYGANIRTRFTVWLTMTEAGYKDAYAEYD